MKLELGNRKWKSFYIRDVFEIINSKAYHKSQLEETNREGISYVSRTNLNNGVESIIKKGDFETNEGNTIVFGAENATFFYQPNEYITGNKMYYLKNDKMNKFSGLFLQLSLNKSIENCGFGYGKGLTGTRVRKRMVRLPVDNKDNPDYKFMEDFIRERVDKALNKYRSYITEHYK